MRAVVGVIAIVFAILLVIGVVPGLWDGLGDLSIKTQGNCYIGTSGAEFALDEDFLTSSDISSQYPADTPCKKPKRDDLNLYVSAVKPLSSAPATWSGVQIAQADLDEIPSILDLPSVQQTAVADDCGADGCYGVRYRPSRTGGNPFNELFEVVNRFAYVGIFMALVLPLVFIGLRRRQKSGSVL